MKLDPRNLPKSYPEMLQDLIAMHERLELFDSTEAKNLALMLGPAVMVAESQLDRITENALKRIMGS